MKYLYFTTFILAFFLLSCKQVNKTTENKQTLTVANNDSVSLTDLVRNVYKWHDTTNPKIDFDPQDGQEQDSLYTGLDMKKHERRLKDIENTNFFSKDFLDNYNKIAQKIDNDLKTKKIVWAKGEIPPFGNDADPWCNCQDNPDKYWEKITIRNIVIDKDVATFNWTWGDDFEYKVKARKENSEWKITYLQGFDFDEFTKY